MSLPVVQHLNLRTEKLTDRTSELNGVTSIKCCNGSHQPVRLICSGVLVFRNNWHRTHNAEGTVRTYVLQCLAWIIVAADDMSQDQALL